MKLSDTIDLTPFFQINEKTARIGTHGVPAAYGEGVKPPLKISAYFFEVVTDSQGMANSILLI
jgi:hypothetical protein